MSNSNEKIKKFELTENVKNTLNVDIPEGIKNILKNIKIDIPKLEIDYEAFYKASENIGKLGWTVPFTFTLFQIRFFGDGSLTKEDIDTFFDDYYSEDKNFDRMISAILSINDINHWHEAIKQSAYAHRNNMFILSISTLIPVLEGMLSTFESDKTNIRMMKVCKDMLDKIDENLMIDIIPWTSCYHFISALYQKSDFSGKEPEIVNRHWILHGRTAFNNSKTDSIRIFNAIETVSNIIKHHNKKQNKK